MTIKELLEQADTVLKDEKLREMFKRCFLSTLERLILLPEILMQCGYVIQAVKLIII